MRTHGFLILYEFCGARKRDAALSVGRLCQSKGSTCWHPVFFPGWPLGKKAEIKYYPKSMMHIPCTRFARVPNLAVRLKQRAIKKRRGSYKGSVSGGGLTQGGAPCGRLPWAVLGRAVGASAASRRHAAAGARTHGLMRHDPMAWTRGTQWTPRNDALTSLDSLRTP